MVRLNPDNDAREIIINELMTLISDIRNGATINKFRLDRDPYCYILHASIIPKQLPKYDYVKKAIDDIPMSRELEEKGKKNKTKKDYIDCTFCEYHDYDWDVNDGYGGDEYEICEKGNELFPKECKDFKEL